jgi:hypothetical protein
MAQVMSCSLEEPPACLVRSSRTPSRTRLIDLAAYHGKSLAILATATLILFRTWISSRYPGGADSAFLYSGLPFYEAHGLQLFTVWLPTPLGQVSQYSMYWLLAMLMTVFRSALLTYKLAAISIALVSAIGMYAMSWSWSRSRLGALAAAIFYSFSPMSIAQWLSGHLDVQLSMAVGPLMIWSIGRLADTGSRRAAIGLGLCASALLLLTTGQAAYWIVAVVAIIASRLLTSFRNTVCVLRRTLPGCVLAAMVFIAASAVQLGPWLLGAHAAFAGGQNLAIETLAIHAKYSLNFGLGILGVPGETWLLPGSNVSFASFGSLLYLVPQIAILTFASLSAFMRKGSWYKFLLLMTACAWLLEAGPFGPAGSAYAFVWQHVTYFRELRAPSRWQMISSFAVAVMLAMSVAEVANWNRAWRLKRRQSTREGRHKRARLLERYATKRRWGSAVRNGPWGTDTLPGHSVLLIAGAGALLTLNAGAVLARGLPTITPPSAYVSTYSALARAPGDWRVLTVPFGQAWMGGPTYGDYEGIAADLGYTSSFYDRRSVLGNGGWDPRASQFVSFLESVVNQGVDRHLAGLLGAAGVRYIVSNPEPAILAPSGQANFFMSQRGLRLVSSGHGMMTLRNPFAQSLVSQPATDCVIAGGYPVLEDLTEDPAFSFRRTAVYFADQVVQTGGWPTLVRLVMRDHCLIMGPGAGGELAVLRGSVASAQAISIAPSGWPSGPIDPLLDSQANAADWVDIPSGHSLAWKADVRVAGWYRVWVRVLRQPGAAPVPVAVDGVAAGSVDPAVPATVGFQWLPAGTVELGRGAARVILRAGSGGVSPEVAEFALVHAGNRQEGAVPGIKHRQLVVDKNPLDAALYRHPRIEWSHPLITSQWRDIAGIKAAGSRRGWVTLTPTALVRQKFAMAYAFLPRVIDAETPVAFRFQGTASGATFYLNFYFRNGSEKSFSFEDISRRPRLLFFTPQQGKPAWQAAGNPDAGNPYVSSLPQLQVPVWNQVRYMTFSSNSRTWQGGTVHIAGPFRIKQAHSLPYFVGHLPIVGATRSVPGLGIAGQTASAAASVHNLRPGILDFAESFNPQWHLTGAQAGVHTVELGFENSYLVKKAALNARLVYQPAAVGIWGTIVSILAWCMALASLAIWPLGARVFRGRRRGHGSADGGNVDPVTEAGAVNSHQTARPVVRI